MTIGSNLGSRTRVIPAVGCFRSLSYWQKPILLSVLLGWFSGCGHTAAPLPESAALPILATGPVWIDTDLVVDPHGLADPDDLIALRLLEALPPQAVIGMSASYGNGTPTRTAASLARYVEADRVFAPEAVCSENLNFAIPTDAAITIVALGPATNLPTLINCFRQRQIPVREVIFVGGRTPGEEFWLSHLLPFIRPMRDLNFEVDRAAFRRVVDLNVPITLIPFRSGNSIRLRLSDVVPVLDDFGYEAVRNWIATLSLVGGNWTMPSFDPTAAAYLLWPQDFSCRQVFLQITEQELLARFDVASSKRYQWCTPRSPLELVSRMRHALSAK